MTRLKLAYYLSIAGSTTTLAVGYALSGLWYGLPPVLVAPVLWLWGDRQGRSWLASAGLTLVVIMAAVGSLLAIAPGWAIGAVAAGLVGWDIGRFNRAMSGVPRVNNAETIERRYRRRLLLVATLGAVAAMLATTVRLNFGFSVALLLGIVSIIGFSRAISYLQQANN